MIPFPEYRGTGSSLTTKGSAIKTKTHIFQKVNKQNALGENLQRFPEKLI